MAQEKTATVIENVKLTPNQVWEICDEIEDQWLYLVMTRAVFRADFPAVNKFKSPSFYQQYEIVFNVSLPTVKSKNFKRAAAGIKNWHNQNYVIRLYGILEKYQIMYAGRKLYDSQLMKLIYELRPKIGAHSAGRKPRDPDGLKHLRKATRLINEIFKPKKEFNIDEVKHYSLPLDAVLEPMKNKAQAFVKSLKI
jgi:hypothetical protein